MLDYIQNEIDDIINRTLDRSLRIAVTGLSRSGKTAFITSLMNQLLNINQLENKHLPLFQASRNKSIIAVKRIGQKDLKIPRFDYESNLNSLMKTPPEWPSSTTGVSETRLAIRYQRQQGVMRHFKDKSTLYIDIFDYPGEWLLDLPLLSLSYQQWSLQQASLPIHYQARYQALSTVWLEKLKKIDLTTAADEDILAQIAKDYTDFLFSAKAEGLHFIQPGRFVLPGELAGSPALQFFPLIHLKEEEWRKLSATKKSGSYFSVLTQRYEFYRQKIVKVFYQDYFSTFDRQVILADCLSPLNHSQQAFLDMKEALQQLFNNFHYGKRSLLHRLFSPNIDKLMFIATKADHITTDQLPNLMSLMKQLVQEGGHYVAYEGIETDYTAISAIRATKQVSINKDGQVFKAIQGMRSSDHKNITLYPGSVPNRLPNAEFWDKQKFEFDTFEPQPLGEDGMLPHLRMDLVLQFLLADKLD
ncbi:hypothetical protein EV697_101522 [Bisgaardia hudsonensis]|uniref:YcjX family protein n=1 Tax=Bisgaardia hudsonensis TaxID=109472 RepID=A0A4R2N3C2_9PAST|nr:YcjX family protein [Bisgaardia hudsonensis]QLB12823.1 hypothetical protein A6A11_03980 [Bisgaardia hudsonensis]TCP14381.1 hypothetical protein EV697_101522 [Bisgaardia hudsonensis]